MGSGFYAFDAIDDAISRTKTLLWPFRAGVWFRLALIALFVGGFGGGFNIFSYNLDSGPDMGMPLDPGVSMALVLALIGIVLLLALIFLMIGSILQFVFVDCLSSGTVSLSRTFGLRSGKGLRLFLFQFGLMLLIFAAIALLALILIFPAGMTGTPNVVFFLLMLPVLLVLAIIVGVVMMLTIDFVVPVMIRDDCGVITGWRRVWGFVRADLKNTAVYVVFKFVLGIVVGLIVLLLALLVLAVIAVPLLVVGAAAMYIMNGAVLPFYLLLLGIGVLIAIPFLLLVQVPFVTFFRYYSLGVLSSFTPDYDLLPPGEASA
ncbi:DUF7544 domain-containing protein [Methanofollis fontis]|uniref:Glycerophosphoryl diester phosphodiesterase membrane domain-containing protein n=1 Tax=Methanofollis fontis TaxID=2052832 RepID=A0A483CUZ5_9EURY|nr:hypothetical protein [Methanofollis fontis]TAJ44787.1 hypothetical protein CUJ86_05700 [Methanofollis fontis]